MVSVSNNALAQTKETNTMFFDAGSNAGFIGYIVGYKQVPLTFTFEKRVKKNFLLGLALTWEKFKGDVQVSEMYRYNVRARFIWEGKGRQSFVPYQGLALGVSHGTYWRTDGAINLPSLQYFMGLRVKLGQEFYIKPEIGLGSPYAAQIAVGSNF